MGVGRWALLVVTLLTNNLQLTTNNCPSKTRNKNVTAHSAWERVGISCLKSLLCRVQEQEIEFDVMTAIHLPVTERVLDKLADILFATDEILDMLHVEETVFDARTIAVEKAAQSVYDQINELMKTLSD